MWKFEKSDEIKAGMLIKNIPILTSLDPKVPFKQLAFSVIMTQPCDISSHYKTVKSDKISRQILTQILFCPAFEASHIFEGTHLQNTYDHLLPKIDEQVKKSITSRQNSRYYYLPSQGQIPSLVVDFKHYFTLPISYIISFHSNFNDACFNILEDIVFAQLSDYFAHYLQRIGLPDHLVVNN